MNKEKNVVDFYVLCNKLKNIIRTGWKAWNVKSERVESIAEHIYGVQMLAIAIWSEYKYNVDLKKVILMLSVHEMEEIFIGDLSPFDMDEKTKEEKGHKAVEKILGNLVKKNEIKNLIFEFDERKTPEAIFAYQCDKLECDIQCKLYDEQNCVNLDAPENKNVIKLDGVADLLKETGSWSGAWIKFGQKTHHYDKNFLNISNYVMKEKINKS